MSNNVFQPNFVTFTNTDIVSRNPISGRIFRGNQNKGFKVVTFADGSQGVEKRLQDWTGNKSGRTYKGELLGAQEYLAARVGEVMNAPIRDCQFTNKDAQSIVMPYIEGESGAENGKENLPDNEQGIALRLFDYLTANSDRRPKNVMWTEDGRIVGIDHALCNFRPRNPSPELITELWNGGVTLDSLNVLKSKFMPLGSLFSQMGVSDKFGNLLDNLDKLIAAYQKVEAIAVAKAAFESQTPPQAVRDAAKKALEWIADGKAGDGFTSVGRKRASDLANGHPVSLDTLKRMKAYFDRHGVDKNTPHWNEPSPGKVAWYAWGGDAGYSWAKKMVARAEKANEAVAKSFEEENKSKGDERVAEAEKLSNQAHNFRRKEQYESAANAHEAASRAFFEASKHYNADDDGNSASALARAHSEKELARQARFTDQMGEQHSPAEMNDGTWVDDGAWSGGIDPVNKGDLPGHDFHGNQYTTGEGVAQEVAEKVRENGGLSVKLIDGSEPIKGFMVATDSKFGAVVDEKDFFDPAKTEDILNDYLLKHQAELGKENNYLGLWLNDGKVYLDVSENIEDKEAAIKAGQDRDQISIWDVAAQDEVPTGGTGNVGEAQPDSGNQVAKGHRQDGQGRDSHVGSPVGGQTSRRAWNRHLEVLKGDVPGHPFHGNQYDASGVVEQLDNGASPEIKSADLPSLVTGIHDLGTRGEGYNITNLVVDGKTPFKTDNGDDLLREHMPQILPSQRPQFLKDIEAKYGITSKKETVDPRDIKPSQNEIDGWKTGGVFKEFAEKGIPEKRAPLVSSDGYIIDGHHYWSASLAMKAANPDYKLPIQRLSCDIATALHVANEWHDQIGNPRLSLGDAQVNKAGVAGQSGDKPGHEFRGNQWWMMGPDGVPVPRPRPDKGTTSSSSEPKAEATAEMPKPPTALKVPYGKGVVPPGWTIQKQGGNKTIYVSERGNTAVFKNAARGWKVGDRATNNVLAIVDKYATGKKIDFATERKTSANTLAFVCKGDPNTVSMGRHGLINGYVQRAIAKYDPTRGISDVIEQEKARDAWNDLIDRSEGQLKGKSDTADGRAALEQIQDTLEKADQANIQLINNKIGRVEITSDLFMSTQHIIESTVVHELGHSFFFDKGEKMASLLPTLQKLAPSIDWAKANKASQDAFIAKSRRYAATDYGGGLIVPRAELEKFVREGDAGSYRLSQSQQSALNKLGMTQYGSEKLQEALAEAFALTKLGIRQTPLVKAFADTYKWFNEDNSVSKSVSMPVMTDDLEQPIGPKPGSNVYWGKYGETAMVIDLDTLDGPITLIGDDNDTDTDIPLVGPDEQ